MARFAITASAKYRVRQKGGGGSRSGSSPSRTYPLTK